MPMRQQQQQPLPPAASLPLAANYLLFNMCLTKCPPLPPACLPAVPEDYIEYFKEHNVKAVVRLNKKMYEAARFSEAGVRHHEMYFPDGTCPSEQILLRFLDTAEREPGALAVSGLGGGGGEAGSGAAGGSSCC